MQTSFITWAVRALSILICISGSNSNPLSPHPLSAKALPSFPLPVTTLHEFAFPSWCENLAIRSNGQILVSRLDTPELLQVDPTNKTAPLTIATWDAVTYMGALGISETTPDVFAIILAAPVNGSFVKTSGTPSIYKVDMNTFHSSGDEVLSNATVMKIADIATADFLNGMTTLDECHVLVCDVYSGCVYKVDVETGDFEIVIRDPKMHFPSNAETNLGVNGIKIHDEFLYWTNTANGTLNKIRINKSGYAIGESEVVVANVPRADDFVFKEDGTVFVAQNQDDELSVVLRGNREAMVVAGSPVETVLAGVTAGKLGRLKWDKQRLYLTTSGGLALPINGTVIVPGKVAYIDTTGF